jgi:hypothetical protein
MIYTSYADLWFRHLALPERAAHFAELSIHHLDA